MQSIIRPLLAGMALSGLLSAVAATHLTGGEQIIVPPGAFVTGTILRQDNVTLQLPQGARLLGSANPLDYLYLAPFGDATGQTRGKCLIRRGRCIKYRHHRPRHDRRTQG